MVRNSVKLFIFIAMEVIKFVQSGFSDRIRSTVIPGKSLCSDQFQSFVSQLKSGDKWANDMLSSYSNFDKTFYKGNSFDFGDFDRCLKIDVKDLRNTTLKGKHCLIQYQSLGNRTLSILPKVGMLNREWKKMNRRFSGAICIPDSCSTEMISVLMDQIFKGKDLKISTEYNQDDFCQIRANKPLKVTDHSAVCVVVLLTLLVVSSTCYDYFCCERMRNNNNLFLAFSAFKNTKELFRSSPSLGYLSGIKALSCFGIILHHSILLRLYFPHQDPQENEDFHSSPIQTIVFVLGYGVDSFLLISGFLVTKSVLQQFERGKFNILKTYFQRYMRTTPVIAVLVLGSFYHFNHSAKAPYFFRNQFIKNCEKSWFYTVFHVQNYFSVHQPCNPVAWYLAVDFQLFLMTPLIVYPFWKLKKSAVFILPGLIIAARYVKFLEADNIQDSLNISNILTDFHGDYAKIYHQTHFRSSPWIVGIMLGYFVSENKTFRMNKVFSVIMCIFPCCILLLLLTSYESEYFTPIFFSNHRLLWAIAVGWLMMGCHFNFFKSLNKFLSLQIWKPLEKIGLSLYLTHSGIISYFVLSNKKPIEFSGMTMIHDYCADLILSVLAAFCCFLFVEKPFIVIGKYLTNEERQNHPADNEKNEVLSSIKPKSNLCNN